MHISMHIQWSPQPSKDILGKTHSHLGPHGYPDPARNFSLTLALPLHSPYLVQSLPPPPSGLLSSPLQPGPLLLQISSLDVS